MSKTKAPVDPVKLVKHAMAPVACDRAWMKQINHAEFAHKWYVVATNGSYLAYAPMGEIMPPGQDMTSTVKNTLKLWGNLDLVLRRRDSIVLLERAYEQWEYWWQQSENRRKDALRVEAAKDPKRLKMLDKKERDKIAAEIQDLKIQACSIPAITLDISQAWGARIQPWFSPSERWLTGDDHIQIGKLKAELPHVQIGRDFTIVLDPKKLIKIFKSIKGEEVAMRFTGDDHAAVVIHESCDDLDNVARNVLMPIRTMIRT